MSDKPIRDLNLDRQMDLQSIKDRRSAACQIVSDLCHKRREWVMHIPVSQDDPDIVIGEALRDSFHLIEQVTDLQTQLAEARKALREAVKHAIHTGVCNSRKPIPCQDLPFPECDCWISRCEKALGCEQ